MSFNDRYNIWLKKTCHDSDALRELALLREYPDKLKDSFSESLDFGTGGIRGLMGIGPNRINKYTIRKTTQGLVEYLKKNTVDFTKGVAIAYDSRHNSENFAMEAALVLCANGIKTYFFESLRPTPLLSFSVRHLGCAAGIVITASHNPPEYNGYKVYGPDGGQITTKAQVDIKSFIDNIDTFRDVKMIKEDEALANGLISIIGAEIDKAYLDCVLALSKKVNTAETDRKIKIVYTPLHGTGLLPVTNLFSRMGYKENIYLVKSQMQPDGNFPTVRTPNPECKEAFSKANDLALEVNADVILATDPDCDRIGVSVKTIDNKYKILSGNQIGALLGFYMMTKADNVVNNFIIKTIVTSEFGANIAKDIGVEVVNTLTGFKFIGEKIKDLEGNDDKTFLFGYEESNGYLAGTFVRDKDAVIAAMLIVGMVEYYLTRGKTLIDILEELYIQYGYYLEDLETYTFKGTNWISKVNGIIEKFRDRDKVETWFNGIEIIEDYSTGIRTFTSSNNRENIDLPSANIIKITFISGSWFALRPSGTEPKLKIYYSVVSDTLSESEKTLLLIKSTVKQYIHTDY